MERLTIEYRIEAVKKRIIRANMRISREHAFIEISEAQINRQLDLIAFYERRLLLLEGEVANA